jgi:hypothetical protein
MTSQTERQRGATQSPSLEGSKPGLDVSPGLSGLPKGRDSGPERPRGYAPPIHFSTGKIHMESSREKRRAPPSRREVLSFRHFTTCLPGGQSGRQKGQLRSVSFPYPHRPEAHLPNALETGPRCPLRFRANAAPRCRDRGEGHLAAGAPRGHFDGLRACPLTLFVSGIEPERCANPSPRRKPTRLLGRRTVPAHLKCVRFPP